jgi:hypothetical protein
MTAIQQTVEIDAGRRVLTLEKPLPESIPCGTARVILQFVPSPEPASPASAKWVNPLLGRAKKLGLPPIDERKAKYQAARRKLRELCGGSSLTVERFLAMKNEERALEAAQEKSCLPWVRGGDPRSRCLRSYRMAEKRAGRRCGGRLAQSGRRRRD